MTKNLLVVDDHEIVREGLRLLLEGTEIVVSDRATTAAEALASVEKSVPDVVLMDIRMDGGDGLNALGRLKLDYQDLPIVMFSAYDNPTYIARAVALGGGRLHIEVGTSPEIGGSVGNGGNRRVSLDARRIAPCDGCIGNASVEPGYRSSPSLSVRVKFCDRWRLDLPTKKSPRC